MSNKYFDSLTKDWIDSLTILWAPTMHVKTSDDLPKDGGELAVMAFTENNERFIWNPIEKIWIGYAPESVHIKTEPSQKLQEKLDIAIKALDFYANGRENGQIAGVEYDKESNDDVFIGQHARKTLEKLK